MKKFIALFTALILCLSMASAAFAADVDIVTVDWADYEADAAEMDPDGQFAIMFTLDEGKQACIMWIPSVFVAAELSDEDFEDGMLAYLTTEDESAYVTVFQVDLEGITLDEYVASAEEEGYTDIKVVEINGIYCLHMVDEENDAAVIMFVTDAGIAAEFAFSPISDEGFAVVAEAMAASMQIIEQ